jgi:TolB-like protein/class 3 adenylate cyclase
MSTELESDLQLEIAHVLFIDIVGYSKLLINEQHESMHELNQVVRNTEAFRIAETAGKLIRLPTGDGMALAFATTPDAPVRCALQVSKALQNYPNLKVRMGVNSGPVSGTTDVNDRSNVAGVGINIAQRVMDCGDAGHILLSKRVAEDLAQYRHWQPYLHDLGQCEVKHREVISLVNLYTDEVGNPQPPAKLKCSTHAHPVDRTTDQGARARRRKWLLAAAVLLTAIGFWIFWQRGAFKSSQPPVALNVVSSIPEKSIAVLPFENLSANQETAFFTDGVQDEILSDLAKVADLKVISRTSVMQYKTARARNLREIGRQLGVAHVLEGSVQRAGNRVRINAQLIDARTDAHLWAQSYDRDLADVFAIQSEIAKTIADQLQAKISPKEEAALGSKPTEDMVAFDLYLQATQIDRNRSSALGSGGAEEAKREIGLLNEAIKRDPAFVPAICLLVQTHLYLHWINVDQPAKHLESAKKALDSAVRLQPNAAQVHVMKALLHYWGSREYAPALAELALARSNLPNDYGVLYFTAMIERRQGNWLDSTRRLEQAFALDPCNISVISELCGSNYLVLRRYDDDAKMLDGALAWKPLDFNLAYLRAFIDFDARADLRRWKQVVVSEAAKAADPNDVVVARTDLALKERDYHTAEQILADRAGAESDDNGFFTPHEWKQAIIARGLGDQSRATAAFLIARQRVAAKLQEQPEDAKALIVLGQIDAELGRKEEALQEGQHAVELLPITKDAINGYHLLLRLAGIYAQVGEADRALDLLEREIRQPYGLSYGSLKLDEVWDPLRHNPRFEKIVAALAPKDAQP